LRGAGDRIGGIDLNVAFNAELPEISVQIETESELPAG
jgi:hypothetical protein